MQRLRLFSRPERASQNPIPHSGWGDELSQFHDYQLLCEITSHVPHSILVWTKSRHFARPTCTLTVEHVPDHLNVHMHRCYAYHRYVCILYHNSSLIIAAKEWPITVTDSTAELTSTLRARIHVLFDSVPYSRHIQMLPDQALRRCAPFTTMITDDAVICQFCLLSLMVSGFARHRTSVPIVPLSFSASNSSRMFCRLSVPFPMYGLTGTAWISGLSQVSFPWTSTTSFWTVLAAVMMMSGYCTAISAAAFWCAIAVTAPLALLLAFMILMSARVCWWNRALFIADAISWSILLGSCKLSSLSRIRRLSAILQPVVRAGAGLAGFFWFRCGTVCHHLVNVGANVVDPFGLDVVLSIGVSADFGAGDGARFGIGFGFGLGTNLGWPPSSSSWGASGFWGSPVRFRSRCMEASRATPSVSAFMSYLWPCSVAATTLLNMSVMPLPHSTSSWWYVTHISSFYSKHIFIPHHCTSCSAVCVSSMCTIIEMVPWGCASFRACFWAARSVWLGQSPRALAVAETSLCSRFLFLFLTLGSTVALPAVSAAKDVTSLAISIAISIGLSLLLSTASPMSR